MILLQTFRDLHESSVPLGQEEAARIYAVPAPSYIPLESGIIEGYKRLGQTTPTLRLPQNSSPPLNCGTTCKTTYFTHQTPVLPSWNQLPSDLFSLLLPYLRTALYHD
jgi:hypothetical protein